MTLLIKGFSKTGTVQDRRIIIKNKTIILKNRILKNQKLLKLMKNRTKKYLEII